MFEFLLSAALVRKILDNIKAEDSELEERLSGIGDIDVEGLRKQWGERVVASLGSAAQYTRYIPAETFVFIKDATFDPNVDESLGGQIAIPTGEAGDVLMKEVAAEFVQWMVEHNPTSTLAPQAPITKIEAEGGSVIVHVRPKDKPLRDPNFVRATEVR